MAVYQLKQSSYSNQLLEAVEQSKGGLFICRMYVDLLFYSLYMKAAPIISVRNHPPLSINQFVDYFINTYVFWRVVSCRPDLLRVILKL